MLQQQDSFWKKSCFIRGIRKFLRSHTKILRAKEFNCLFRRFGTFCTKMHWNLIYWKNMMLLFRACNIFFWSLHKLPYMHSEGKMVLLIKIMSLEKWSCNVCLLERRENNVLLAARIVQKLVALMMLPAPFNDLYYYKMVKNFLIPRIKICLGAILLPTPRNEMCLKVK